MAALPASASTYDDPSTKLALQSGNEDDVTGLVAKNSPRTISGVDTSSPSVSDWWQEEWDTTATDDLPTSEELHAELAELMEETSAWDWSLAPEVAVAAGAGWVGWEIGSEIWGFFHDDAPDQPPSGGSARASLAKVVKPDAELWGATFDDGYRTIDAPSWGVEYYAPGPTPGSVYIPGNGNCDWMHVYGPGQELPISGEVAAFEDFCDGTTEYVSLLFEPTIPRPCGVDAVDCPGIDPTDYVDNQPAAPTAGNLATAIQSALSTSQFPVLNAWLNHQIDPEDFPDPRVRTKEEDHRCDRSPGPTYENPGGSSDPDPFTKYYVTPFDITARPSGHESTNIYLHYGKTAWGPSVGVGPNTVDNWLGWGYRHINAKHGWSAADDAETQNALSTDLGPLHEPNGNWLYTAEDSTGGVGGVSCIRNVVVDFETGEGDPRPRGIVTSFNSVD